jgi:hypothetical protein
VLNTWSAPASGTLDLSTGAQTAPVCGDGVYDPGDTRDYAYGTPNDQCVGSGSRCTLMNPCRCFP